MEILYGFLMKIFATSAFLQRGASAFRTYAKSASLANHRIRLDTGGDEHMISWETADQGILQFPARDGETLRTAAFRNGLISPHNGRSNWINCRGLGTCGTCAVQIEGTSLDPPNSIERVRLSAPPGHPSSQPLRLACQVAVHGYLNVTKYTGFWGQYDEIADCSLPEQPLGELELILDRRRRKQQFPTTSDDDDDRP